MLCHEKTKIQLLFFCFFVFCFCFCFWQEFGRAFSLLEKRLLVVLPIRSYWNIDQWSFSNKKLRPPGICSGATWAGIFFYTEIADLCRLGFIYTEFAGRLRVRGMARIWMVATRLGFSVHRDRGFVEIGLYLHRDCRCIGRCGTRSEMTLLFSSQMQTKFRHRFRVVFSWARIDRDAKI